MLKKIETKKPWLRKKIIFSLLLVIISLTLVEIWVVNRLSTYGEQISKFESSQALLKTENQLIKNRIAQAASLKETEEKAKLAGFDKAQDIQFIKTFDLALTR